MPNSTEDTNLEYSYRKMPSSLDKMWAGPAHWKLKHFQRSPTKSSNNYYNKLSKSVTTFNSIYSQPFKFFNLSENIEDKIKCLNVHDKSKPTNRICTTLEPNSSLLPEKLNIDKYDTVFDLFNLKNFLKRKDKKKESMDIEPPLNESISQSCGSETPKRDDVDDSGNNMCICMHVLVYLMLISNILLKIWIITSTLL